MRDIRLACLLIGAAAWTVQSLAADLIAGHQALVAGDYDRAWEELLPLAEANNHIAAYHVGEMYLEGWGTERDIEAAIMWLTRAAATGHVAAQLRLALIYDAGSRDGENHRLAAQWMQAAAEGGDSDAQYYLGRYYAEGIGVVANSPLAMEWIQRSVEYGTSHETFLDALFFLGASYEWGRGIRQDLVESYKWFALAASYSLNDAQLHTEASRALGALGLRLSAAERAEAERRARSWREGRD